LVKRKRCAGSLRVRHTLTWMAGKPRVLADPKSERGRRVVPLIAAATAALRAQRDRQAFMRATVGGAWRENDLVFTDELGRASYR
jgi:hypothetical protein